MVPLKHTVFFDVVFFFLLRQAMIWLVLNCRSGDSWSVTSTAFGRTPISSLISNHHRAGSMLSLLANTQLSNGCNTVFAITSVKCDRRAQQSLACTRQLKSQPEKCEGGNRCFRCLLQWRRLWKKTSTAHYQHVRAFVCWLAWKLVFSPLLSSPARISQAGVRGVRLVAKET